MTNPNTVTGSGYRVLICGSRKDVPVKVEEQIRERLEEIAQDMMEAIYVIHGAALGVDSMAERAADSLGIECIPFPVSKAEWAANPKTAGHIRNQKMLDEGLPDYVIAWWDGVSGGTLNMISKSVQRGLPVEIHPIVRG